MCVWENSTFYFCNKVKDIALPTFKAVQSQKTFRLLFFIKFNKFAFICHAVIKGIYFVSVVAIFYIYIYIKSYENVLTPGGIPKADEIGACGALSLWKWLKEVFAILYDSKQLLWRLFYHSTYEKKDKYSIDFTFELVSGGY